MNNLERAIARIDHGICIANECFDDIAVEDLKICKQALEEKDRLLDMIHAAKEEYEGMPGIGNTIVYILNDIENKLCSETAN